MWPTWSRAPLFAAAATRSARVLDAIGHRLLDEDGDAALEERQRDGVVMERGDDDADRLRAVEQKFRRRGPFGVGTSGRRPSPTSASASTTPTSSASSSPA